MLYWWWYRNLGNPVFEFLVPNVSGDSNGPVLKYCTRRYKAVKEKTGQKVKFNIDKRGTCTFLTLLLLRGKTPRKSLGT
jgi:hypothetical protein